MRALAAVGGRSVRCLSPELQLRHHLGYIWDDNDQHDMKSLETRFNLSLPPRHPS